MVMNYGCNKRVVPWRWWWAFGGSRFLVVTKLQSWSGFSAVGSPSTKCRLQTLETLLGIQSVPFKLFLLIFFAHCNRRSGFFFSVGNGNNLKGGWQSHMLEPLLQPRSSQVVAAHFPSLCPLLGQPMTTQFRWPNPMDKVSILKQKKYDLSLSLK